MKRLSLLAALAFIASCGWSGLVVGQIQVSDLCLAVVLATGGVAAFRRAVPPKGAWIFLGAVVVANVAAILSPPDPAWLSMRFTGWLQAGTATRAGLGAAGLGAWAIPVKLTLGLLGGWAVIARLHEIRPDVALKVIPKAWVFGALSSSVVAVAQSRGLDTSGWLAQPVTDLTVEHRVNGLAFHPNAAAMYIATALPMTALLPRGRALLVAAILWAGLLGADSRIGLAAGVAGTALAAALALRATNAKAIVTGFAALCVASPLIGTGARWLFTQTRLATGRGHDSDVGRALVNEQSHLDFLHSPVFGLGQGVGGGVSAPLVMLSSGGIVAATGALVFIGWALTGGWMARRSREALIMMASAVVVLLTMAVQPTISDRGIWVPFLVLGFAWHQERAQPQSREDDSAAHQRMLTVT